MQDGQVQLVGPPVAVAFGSCRGVLQHAARKRALRLVRHIDLPWPRALGQLLQYRSATRRPSSRPNIALRAGRPSVQPVRRPALPFSAACEKCGLRTRSCLQSLISALSFTCSFGPLFPVSEKKASTSVIVCVTRYGGSDCRKVCP